MKVTLTPPAARSSSTRGPGLPPDHVARAASSAPRYLGDRFDEDVPGPSQEIRAETQLRRHADGGSGAEAGRRGRSRHPRGQYKGPLHGIPWGAKDFFATKGIPTTWGAAPFQNQVFDYDATIVERLSAAGAVLVAKLSMGALAQGDSWFSGRTNNPWNLERGLEWIVCRTRIGYRWRTGRVRRRHRDARLDHLPVR